LVREPARFVALTWLNRANGRLPANEGADRASITGFWRDGIGSLEKNQ
jgi:hypothetical protein